MAAEPDAGTATPASSGRLLPVPKDANAEDGESGELRRRDGDLRGAGSQRPVTSAVRPKSGGTASPRVSLLAPRPPRGRRGSRKRDRPEHTRLL